MTLNNGLASDVRKIISEILEMEPQTIDADAHLIEDLGMDSMMALEILASVERKFKIKIPEDNMPKMTTLNKIAEVAYKYVNA